MGQIIIIILIFGFITSVIRDQTGSREGEEKVSKFTIKSPEGEKIIIYTTLRGKEKCHLKRSLKKESRKLRKQQKRIDKLN